MADQNGQQDHTPAEHPAASDQRAHESDRSSAVSETPVQIQGWTPHSRGLDIVSRGIGPSDEQVEKIIRHERELASQD